MSTPDDQLTSLFSTLTKKVWYYPLIRGIVALIFGVLALAWPGATVLALIVILGAMWTIDGIVAIIDGVRRRGTPGAGWEIAFGVLGTITGLVLLLRPGLSAAVLLIVAGAWALAGGIVLIISSIRARKVAARAWGWGIAAGVATALFGVLVLAQPGIAAITLVFMLGFYAIALGIVLIALAFVIRNAGRRVEPASSTSADLD